MSDTLALRLKGAWGSRLVGPLTPIEAHKLKRKWLKPLTGHPDHIRKAEVVTLTSPADIFPECLLSFQPSAHAFHDHPTCVCSGCVCECERCSKRKSDAARLTERVD